MRAALAGLTTRGRSFLAAGLTTALCALLLGQQDLFRVAVLLCGLPLACALVLARTRYRVAGSRRLEPPRVPAGDEARVVVALDNVSRLPTGLLLVEDKVPYVLGTRPRFVLERVEPRGRREVAYRVRSDLRGRFLLGPLTLRLTDPFGMCELARSFTARDSLVVTPPVHPLPRIQLGGDWGGSGESRSRSVAAAGEDDVATREYRRGDDLRRVHWRSTARYGELMVRREEQPWESRATLLLDTRAVGHRGDGPGSSFEWAVSAAASVGVHLARHGFAVRLVTESGADVTSAVHEPGSVGGDFEGLLLDALAVLSPSTARSVVGVSRALRQGGGQGLLVAVLGALTLAEAEDLARVRQGTSTAVAFLVDSESWLAHSGVGVSAGDAAVLLRRAGWRVVPVRRGDDIAERWPYAAYAPHDAAALVPAGGAA